MDKEVVGDTHTHTHTHTHWHIPYSATRKKILPLATIWINFEGITLNETSQTKTNIACYYLYVESKKAELIETESRVVVSRG